MVTRFIAQLFAVFLGLVSQQLTGCVAHTDRSTTALNFRIPERVTARNAAYARIAFFRMKSSDARRAPLRAKLVTYLTSQTSDVLSHQDYAKLVEHLVAFTELYTREEFDRGELSAELLPVANALVKAGSMRGEEAHVLSALFVLSKLANPAARYEKDYESLNTWGKEARTFGNEDRRYEPLIQVWREHARITPASSVLERLLSLHIERRNAVLQALSLEAKGNLGLNENNFQRVRAGMQIVTRLPYEVAAVYLLVGDLVRAQRELENMGSITGAEGPLAQVLAEALRPQTQADALLVLARAYIERTMPEVVVALCRLGIQEHPQDPRFALCQARIAAAKNDGLGTPFWYSQALRLSPNTRILYDEALTSLRVLIEQRGNDVDPAEMRQLAHHAQNILKERLERFSKKHMPVGVDALYTAIARAELNAGNIEEARHNYQESLRVRSNPDTWLQLGALEMRVGNARDALRLLQEGLKHIPKKDPESIATYAEMLERLGDAQRIEGQLNQAQASYRQALSGWKDVLPYARGPALAIVHIRQGVILDRLGEVPKAQASFENAVQAAPTWREAYAQILSYLVVAKPDVPYALSFFRRAQQQLTLEPEWKVYFALWMQAISTRAQAQTEPEVHDVLQDHASSKLWWGRLAKLGARQLPFTELLSEAQGAGQKAETYFYEGIRLLGTPEPHAAREKFQAVLQTQMVNFYEYLMAQELLRSDAL